MISTDGKIGNLPIAKVAPALFQKVLITPTKTFQK
jgi:hypothetical protein